MTPHTTTHDWRCVVCGVITSGRQTTDGRIVATNSPRSGVTFDCVCWTCAESGRVAS